MIKIQLLRHATLILSFADLNILVDPMFAEAKSLPPIPMTANTLRNPLVELPISLKELPEFDAVMITHDHIDHFDKKAKEILNNNILLFCQPTDVNALTKSGFTNLIPIQYETKWRGTKILRVNASHGSGIVKKFMGKASGFILKRDQYKTIYIAGDGIYDNIMKNNIADYSADIIIVNGGAARMKYGNPITMNQTEIINLAKDNIDKTIIAVHMEAINHCPAKRDDLKKSLELEGLKNVIIPDDGQTLYY